MKNSPTFIDLFSGAGGLTLGFETAGFKNLFSIDNEKNYCKTYRSNFPSHNLIEKDILLFSKNDIKNILRDQHVNVVVGGPPCQGFSIAGNIGRRFIDDPRNHLFKEFVRIVDIVQPDTFMMENVARLYTHNNGNTREEIILNFKKIGYYTECKILNSADFGVPQLRKRVIFIGVKINKNSINKKYKINFPAPNVKKYKIVSETLKGMPVLKSGESSNIANHTAMNHSDQMLKKMSYVKNGGNRYEIPEKIRPKTGDVRKYIRYKSDSPSITVTGDMRKVFHPFENRALTVRELARLQTFPDNFIFEGPSISQQQQVGNAVPPKMAEALAKSLINMINEK
jgi:DNA (cytosine-5)-methyltransferase 1